MTWSSGDLETASYGGVSFSVQRVSDDVARRLAQYRYPYVDGGDLEDRGREPRTTALTAVFHGPNYLTELSRFLRQVDTEDSKTFVHPLLGTWTAKVRRLGIVHEETSRDMATVEIEVVEDGTRTSLPILFSVAQLSADVTSEVTATLAAGAALPSKSAWDKVQDALSDLEDAVDSLQSAVDTAVSTVDNAINDVRSRAQAAIDTVRNVYESTVLEAYSVVKRVNTLVYKCGQLAESATAAVPTMVEHVVEAHQTTGQLAHELYGDPDRAEEFEELNRIRHPGKVPPGTKLRVYSE